MNKEVLAFNKVKPDSDFMDEVFTYNVKELERTSSITISKYAIALSQFLIYMKSEINRKKATLGSKKRALDAGVNQLITKSILKEYKTKTDASSYIISNNKELVDINDGLEVIKGELMLLDGMDKTIGELIATFKRELTRRENEMYVIRKENS